ncbi:MAG: magnesium/cobalt transporter CorA [Armatimonadetes bacterium]|nr:magnesium/cobalt transporter CorA [Armatimonadota bacterium]
MLTITALTGPGVGGPAPFATPEEAAAGAASAPVWIDIRDPERADVDELGRAFAFHPLALEDVLKQRQRPKVDVYGDHLLVSVRYWEVADRVDGLRETTREIDVFLRADCIVTLSHDGCAPLRELADRVRNRRTVARLTPGVLLYELLDAVMDGYFPVLDDLDNRIDAVEDAVFDDSVPFDPKPALHLKKELLVLRQAVSPLRDVLNELLRGRTDLVPEPVHVFLQDVYDHALRLTEQIDLHRDILAGALDAAVAMAGNRMNQVMKTLTVVSTVLMSASLVAGIYGMNFQHMPELAQPYGYPAALSAMAVIALCLLVVFRRLRFM